MTKGIRKLSSSPRSDHGERKIDSSEGEYGACTPYKLQKRKYGWRRPRHSSRRASTWASASRSAGMVARAKVRRKRTLSRCRGWKKPLVRIWRRKRGFDSASMAASGFKPEDRSERTSVFVWKPRVTPGR